MYLLICAPYATPPIREAAVCIALDWTCDLSQPWIKTETSHSSCLGYFDPGSKSNLEIIALPNRHCPQNRPPLIRARKRLALDQLHVEAAQQRRHKCRHREACEEPPTAHSLASAERPPRRAARQASAAITALGILLGFSRTLVLQPALGSELARGCAEDVCVKVQQAVRHHDPVAFAHAFAADDRVLRDEPHRGRPPGHAERLVPDGVDLRAARRVLDEERVDKLCVGATAEGGRGFFAIDGEEARVVQ